MIFCFSQLPMEAIHHGINILFVCFILIFVAALIDFWTGVDAAKANKEPISSSGLRRTVRKIIEYLRIVIFAALIDTLGYFLPWYAMPYCVMIVTLGVLLIEMRSVIENSKKKKSSSGEIMDVCAKIISCATHKDAERLIELIKQNENDRVKLIERKEYENKRL